MGSAAVLQNPQLVVFLGTIVQLVGLAGDDAMANLSQIIAEIPVIGTGDGQSLAVLLGIHGHKEVDIVRCRLILLAQHGGDNRLQSLEQIGLAHGVLAHVKLAGNLAHGITIIDRFGVDTQIYGFLRGQQKVHLLGDMRPILVGTDFAAILVELEQVNLTLFIHDSADGNLVIALLLVLDPDGNIGQGRDCGEHGITKICIASGTRGQSINVLEKIQTELRPCSPELCNEIDDKQAHRLWAGGTLSRPIFITMKKGD